MALTQDPANLITDPLALRFMTGDQMGYMPQAQYLTPAEYGAFRTLPGPQGNNYLNQDPGFLQSFLIKTRGSLGILPAYTFNTYNPAVNPQQYMYRMLMQSDDSIAAGVGVGADTLASMLVGAMIGGVPGMAASMFMPDISKPVLDRIRDMRGIQNMTMSKIVAGNDVNAVTGMGFNAASARSLDSFLRISSSGDALMKQGDWRKLLQLGIEHGQFDYAGNAEQYKDALKKLRKSITTVMEVAGSTDFKDVMKEYKRLQTMGASLSEYTSIMRKEDMYSRITGLSHADMVNTYGQQGALIYQQAGLTGYQGSLQAMHNAASITLMQRSGLLTPGTLSRYGGISGLTQTMTQQDAVAQNKIADFLLPYFMNDDASGLDDSKSLTDLIHSNDPFGMTAREAGRKVRTPEQMMRYQHSRGDLMQQFQERYGQENITVAMAFMTGHQFGFKGTEALEFGYRQMGYDPNIAHLNAKKFTSSDFREQEERELQLARRKLREERDLAENPFRKFALALDKTFTRLGENVFGGVANWYAGWTERGAANAEGNFLVGGGLPNSKAWQDQVNKDTSFSPTPNGPTPHPVTDLAELAEPAETYFSGGNSGKVSWNEKDGTRYGSFAWSADQMKEFGEWVKTRDPKGADWTAQFEKAGGFKNFGSLDEAQQSEIGKVLVTLSADADFAKAQREYVNEKFYKPSFEAMSSGEQAEIMATDVGQKMFFMQTAQGANITRTAAGNGYQSDEPLGAISAKYESGPKGMYDVGYDQTGGTSYGIYQLSTTTPEGGEGSYQDWLKFAEKKGGEWVDIVRELRSAGSLNTGSKYGPAVDAYRRVLKGREKQFEISQREYLMKHHYADTVAKIKEEAPALWKKIENDRGLQEMVFSTAVQHGPGNAPGILINTYKEGRSRDAYIDAVYDERGTRFPSSSKEVRDAVNVRFASERKDIKNYASTWSDDSSPAQSADTQEDLVAAMSAEIAEYTDYAIKKGVSYKLGGNSVDSGKIDCSAWVKEAGMRMMKNINDATGEEVFSEEDIKALEDAKNDTGAAGIIKEFHKRAGGELLTNSQLTPEKARAGMIIGMDTGPTHWDHGRFKGIDHIIFTYTDPKTKKLMISQSSSKGGGVNNMTYKEWYEKSGKDASLYGVDLTRIAKAAKIKRRQGAGAPGAHPTVKSSEADAFHELLKIGKGKFTPEMITAFFDKYRKKANGDKEQLAVVDELERKFKNVLKEDNTKRTAESEQNRAYDALRKQFEADIASIDNATFGPLRRNLEKSRAGSLGRAEDQIEVPQMMQNLSRYDSGIDMIGGTIDWDSIANNLSSVIGKDEKGEQKFKVADLINAIQEHSAYKDLIQIRNKQTSINFAKAILENKKLGLSETDIEAATQNSAVRSMLYSAGMRSLSSEDASKIYQEHLNYAEKYAKGERHNILAVEQQFYKQYIEDSLETNLPGISKLGKEYDATRKELIKRAYAGEDSLPTILKVARLFLEKSLINKPGVGENYKKQFILDAQKLKFTEEWITKRLSEGRGLIAEDIKENPNLSGLKAEDIENFQKIVSGLTLEEPDYAEKKLNDLTTGYNEKLVNKDSLLLRSEAVIVKSQALSDLESYAYRVGIDKDKLLKPEGMEELRKLVVSGNIATKWDLQTAKNILKDYDETKNLPSEFAYLMPPERRGMEDATTYTALNNLLKGDDLWRQVREEDRQRSLPSPQQQQQKNDNGQAQDGQGSPLKDETVTQLKDAINSLVEYLKNQETKRSLQDLNRKSES